MNALRKDKRGVTLIELIVVLAVSLIVFGAVRTGFSSLDRKRVDAACYQLQAALRFAQRSAVMEGREYFVVLDTSAYSVRYMRDDGLAAVIVSEAKLPDGVTLRIASEERMVNYNPKGTPDRGRTLTLAGGGFMRRLTMLPSSGRVELKEMELLETK
jgi:prepilin-type N-terminal cleavage/methylation domain-containing protein